MKVCILSMQKVPNFGSLLQSYSLKKLVEELGCQVRFIDIQPDPDDQKLLPQNRHAFQGEHEKKGLLSKFRRLDRYVLNRLRHKKLDRHQQRLFECFRKENLQIKEEDNQQSYDLCIIGSDEVFNCMSATSWGFTTQLFGNVKQSERVITYAASCGATRYSELNAEMREAIRRSFRRISGFSVRDENTYSFVSELTGRTIEHHFDPVWIADFDEEIHSAQLPSGLPEKYCVVYSYYNRIHHKEEIKTIQEFCRRYHMEPIALGTPQMWIRNYVTASPFEALKVIRQAAYVITDTFHGTIFSEKYNGKYAVVVRGSNQNKLMDLIERLGLENHLMKDFSELEQVYQRRKHGVSTQSDQAEERRRSIEYLKKYLGDGNTAGERIHE